MTQGYGYVPIMVSVHYRRICIDLIFEADIAPIGDRRLGFECEFCNKESRQRYGTRQELIEKQGFELLLAWLQANLRPEKLLVMAEDEGMSWARVINTEDRLEVETRAKNKFPIFVVEPIFSGRIASSRNLTGEQRRF